MFDCNDFDYIFCIMFDPSDFESNVFDSNVRF